MGEKGVAQLTSLSDLHVAETASMEAVLCIFGFASTNPQFDEDTVCTMRKFSDLLKKHTQLKLKIVGHGQPGAPEPLASQLAMERAENVAKEFIRAHGLSSQRMILTHCSNRQPRYSSNEKNRRVELSITSDLSDTNKKIRKSSLLRFLGFSSPREVSQ